MIEPMQPHPRGRLRRWLRPAAGITALVALSAATGWAVAGLAQHNRAPDTALVRKALRRIFAGPRKL